MKEEARYWEALEGRKVRCKLCPRECLIAPGQRGFCRVRTNEGGILYTTGYGEVVSVAMDPIEKKPLYHFYPGMNILSLGPNGCNLACIFCQNWQISQTDVPTHYIPPRELVNLAFRHGSMGIAFTYSEPLIWFEYIIDVARIGRPRGIYTVLVTNGVINPRPLEDLLVWIDAMNVDLKSMNPDFYKKLCRGSYLETTLHTIKRAHEAGIHVEVTNLIIPGHNDAPEEIKALVDWIYSVSPDIPLHFSRFFPHYRLRNVPPTPIETLARAREVAMKRMRYVYVGNVWNTEWNTTYCPTCGEALIIREGYSHPRIRLKNGTCPKCGTRIVGSGLEFGNFSGLL